MYDFHNQVIEEATAKLKETITELTRQKTELEYRISELENVKASLTRLLPVDKRIDKLFGN
jgi:prefoldin subunit 5